MSLALRNLAGELYHVHRLRRRALAAIEHCGDGTAIERAWIEHTAERVQAQNARIRVLLAEADDPHALLAEARELLAEDDLL